MEGLLAPRTRLNVSSISITRTVVLIPGLFFDLYWSRTSVFCCTSSVYTGITQNKLPYLIVAPRKGCGSSPRTEVLGLGEVIECTSLVPGICCSRIPYHHLIELSNQKPGISFFFKLDKGKCCPLAFENPAWQIYFIHSLQSYFISYVHKSNSLIY